MGTAPPGARPTSPAATPAKPGGGPGYAGWGPSAGRVEGEASADFLASVLGEGAAGDKAAAFSQYKGETEQARLARARA